jgi:hypothetical protein
MIGPLVPTIAGITGGMLGGSLDQANASADAASAAMGQYRENHPVLSGVAGLTGGLMAGPEMAKLPAPALKPQPFPALGNISAKDAGKAQRYVFGLAAKSGHTPASLAQAAAQASGKPLTLAEIIGNPAEVGAGALARREGQTASLMSSVVTPRSAAASQRVVDDFAAASGIHPAAARGDIEAFIESNQKKARPLYEEAYKANTNVASPAIDRILETPAGKAALADARVKMQNDMSLMWTPDAELMDQAREGGTAIPGNRGVASGMKLRVYDYVKKALDDQISAAYKAGNNHEGGIIKGLKDRLVSELDKADVTAATGPNSVRADGGAYARARAAAGEYLGAKKNFELGQKHILDDKVSAKDFADTYAKLGDSDKAAYLGGSANKLFALQQAGKLKATAFKSPLIRAKLETIMGRAKAATFIRNMETEERMASFANRQLPNNGSGTAVWSEAMRQQDGFGAGIGPDVVRFLTDSAHVGPLKAAGRMAAGKAMKAADALATRGMSIPVRDEAGRILLTMPADQFAAEVARVPAPQPPLQAPSLTPRAVLPYGIFGSGAPAQRQ